MSTGAVPTVMSWTCEMRDDAMVISLRGDLNGAADFSGLLGDLSGKVVFDLADLGRINSGGVRLWVNFIRAITADVDELSFERCTVAFVAQLNMISGFAGNGRVRSIYAPYLNEQSDEVSMLLLDVDGLDFDNPPAFDTPEGRLVFDDVPESYFSYFRNVR